MAALVVDVMMGLGGLAAQAAMPGLAAPAPGPEMDILHLFWGSGWVVRLVLFTLIGFSIGCFGTVWGIMTAFMGLSTTTSSSIQAVAPGIAEALIATAVGLAAAIPAVVMYNRFARQLRVLTAEIDTFAVEFLNIADRHFLK